MPSSTVLNSIRASIWHRTRSALYTSRLGRTIAERLATTECRSRKYWNDALSSWASPYLGGTLSIDMRNAIVSTMLRHSLRDASSDNEGRSLLDIGCAGDMLADTLDHSFARYVGVDISDVAIERARDISPPAQRCARDYVISDMTTFQPDADFDVIVFNEVLYYLSLQDASAQVDRYSRYLSADGIIAVSTKHDGKSHAIMADLSARFEPVVSTLWQQHEAPSFKIRTSRERPAFVAAIFRPRNAVGDSKPSHAP